jgi:hypothetical protein
MHVVLHEAGHAVEGKAAADVAAAHAVDIAALAAANRDEAPALEAANQTGQAFFAAAGGSGIKGAALDYFKDTEAVTAAAKEVTKAATPAALDAATTKLTKAAAKAQATLAKMDPQTRGYAEAQTYGAALDTEVEKRLAWGKARRALLVSDAAMDGVYAQRDDVKTRQIEPNKTRQLDAFEKHGGRHEVSSYGKGNSFENFAEAYALYRRSPSTLEAIDKKIYAQMKATYP